jgi:hypothetical protein
MHLTDTVWEEMDIWEDLADISEFEYSDSEHETQEGKPDKGSAVTSTKCDDSFTRVALSTTDSYQGCNWDVESCSGLHHLRSYTNRTEGESRTQISKDKMSKVTGLEKRNNAKTSARHQREMRYILKRPLLITRVCEMMGPKRVTIVTRHPSKQQDQPRIDQEESVEEEEGCFEFRPWVLPDIDVSMEDIDEYLNRYPV